MTPTDSASMEQYWNSRYTGNTTSWDLQDVSPPLKDYIDQLTNKNLRILIPGCGNAHEAVYLLRNGFTDITLIDIAPALVDELTRKLLPNEHIRIVLGNFFEHQGEYDLILEQTFFCAIDPSLRNAYVNKMSNLLTEKGKLAGLLFSRDFEADGPPFGGNSDEYENLFQNHFDLVALDTCYNSDSRRSGNELFIILKKKGDQLLQAEIIRDNDL